MSNLTENLGDAGNRPPAPAGHANSLHANVAAGNLGDAGDLFLQRVRRSATTVLGASPVGREVLELCDGHAEERRMILQDRSGGATVIAVVGATGQGKSWLIRQLVRSASNVTNAIRSGNNADEATEKLVWVGPRPPADLDPRKEQFVHCEASKMEPIGMPYLLVDAPGATDDRRAVAGVAARALSLASVLLMVVRRDQLRSHAVAVLAEASEGTLVIPVINAVRKRDDAINGDVEALVTRMRQAAPTSAITAPVIIDDFEVDNRAEVDVGQSAATAVASRVQEELANSWDGDRRRSTRLSALDARFRAALRSVLQDHLPDLTSAVERLNDEARELPGQVAESLLGGGSPLRAAVRSRLRLKLLTETAAIWFPYRTQLGLLNLTHGAWDRVILSLSGSLPSLVGAVWTSAKNLTQQRSDDDAMRDGLRRRSAAVVADRLGPLAVRFRSELARIRDDSAPAASIAGQGRTEVASLAGIDSLQETSQQIFDESVEEVSVARTTALVSSLIGTAMFWLFMAGPIFALYHSYLGASFTTLSEMSGNLDAFPRPRASMLLTSLLLSLLPTSLFAMVVLSLSQSRWRVDRAESQIRTQHHDAIAQLQRDGVLRLQWDDPLLADAEFLLSAGASDAKVS